MENLGKLKTNNFWSRLSPQTSSDWDECWKCLFCRFNFCLSVRLVMWNICCNVKWLTTVGNSLSYCNLTMNAFYKIDTVDTRYSEHSMEWCISSKKKLNLHFVEKIIYENKKKRLYIKNNMFCVLHEIRHSFEIKQIIGILAKTHFKLSTRNVKLLIKWK